jgi:hypothetical protein
MAAVNQKFPQCFQDVSMAKKKINDGTLYNRFGMETARLSWKNVLAPWRLLLSPQSSVLSPAASQKIGRELEAFYARSVRSPRTRNAVRGQSCVTYLILLPNRQANRYYRQLPIHQIKRSGLKDLSADD